MSEAPTTKRILHVIETLDPAAGGPTESVRALITFGPANYIGEAVTLDEPDAPFLKTYPFPVHALGKGKTSLGYSRKLDQWLAANRDRFDGVVVNGLWRYISFAAWRAVRGRKPYVVFPHGMLDPYFKRRYPLKHLKKWVYWLLSEYWVLKGAYRVLFTTTEESQLAEESFWLHDWNGFIVPLGASRPPADGALLKDAFYTQFPELRGKRFVLFLGRIHRKKGCDMLIESFVRLAATDPELHLVMAGPDQQGWSAELQATVAAAGLSDRVHWPGMLKGEVKWGSLFASEVFILPSHQENFGIAVAEAMACGRAVLLADKVNIAPEIAADGAGLMETDTQAGTDRLLERWIAMSLPERAEMERKALDCFSRRYDMHTNAVTIITLFDDAAAPASRP
ncbi:glycosyltransferase [Granulicella tundricola]|uniref:Glycosyl transferase group 1 n=1 Tax=Granulicella tundricola (strain ATCC BAA-1859 / DSM 23138 / MP5ACTX9) TaxID=1198114 RepID=E8WVF3_GRATM|nr:glycosyltransferase [Granulicella tundricola]ADW68401.1 glycosyl transferase group 1 [Granulicella tundricola MP5ACTX9]